MLQTVRFNVSHAGVEMHDDDPLLIWERFLASYYLDEIELRYHTSIGFLKPFDRYIFGLYNQFYVYPYPILFFS